MLGEKLPPLQNPLGEGLLIPRRPGVATWSCGHPRPRGPLPRAGLCRLRSRDREASLLAGLLRGPGRCSWL